jgi:hypothetical protein
MDYNASKHFSPTLLTDMFHQIRNSRFDKEGCIIFMPFGTYSRLLIPVMPQKIEMWHFSD